MQPARFFGYGSLVNAATHSYGGVVPATLRGWRRHWVQSNRRKVAFLSVTEAPETEIEGVVADVGAGGWAALDEREAAYDRLPLPDPLAGVQMYRAAPAFVAEDDLGQPILQSYLDVVVQGFLRLYGEAGVAGFFETTTGWHTPVLDDRAAPIYPRAQELDAVERELVDQHLSRLAVKVLRAQDV